MDYFNKDRVVTLLGLASGFAISSDDIIRANFKMPINDYIGLNFNMEVFEYKLFYKENKDKIFVSSKPFTNYSET